MQLVKIFSFLVVLLVSNYLTYLQTKQSYTSQGKNEGMIEAKLTVYENLRKVASLCNEAPIVKSNPILTVKTHAVLVTKTGELCIEE